MARMVSPGLTPSSCLSPHAERLAFWRRELYVRAPDERASRWTTLSAATPSGLYLVMNWGMEREARSPKGEMGEW